MGSFEVLIHQEAGKELSSENLENWTLGSPTKLGSVFISFRGEDVRKNVISFLVPALRRANINVFIDENEFLGARIEESGIALVIFSKDYTSSEWCLDELAKIKECKDEGSLRVIPIFYRIESSAVENLQGDFGQQFRDLESKHAHQPERTRKWKEALESFPLTLGMRLSKESYRNDRETINSIVVSIKRLLDYIAMAPAKPERKAIQGGSMVTKIEFMGATSDLSSVTGTIERP